jgi:hypothetical protein
LRKLYDLTDTVPVHVEPEEVRIELHQTAGRVDLRLFSPVGRANQPAKYKNRVGQREKSEQIKG